MKELHHFVCVLAATAGVCPAAEAPTIDGKLGPAEWTDALHEQLVGGGDLQLRMDGDVLYVSVTGSARGLVSLCLGSTSEVSVLHASAALGTVCYRRSADSWALRNGFEWAS
jgi:hypothetical protein